MNSRNHIEEFRDAIASAGLTPPDQIIDDGQRHRFSSSGNPRDDSGWYILHGDDRPAGAFGCWREQISVTWKSSTNKKFTPEERAEWKKRMREIEAQREADLKREREQAASTAADLWSRAKPADGHPYLTRKQIPGTSLRQLDGELLVPMRHGPGQLVGLQRIKADGEKKFVYGTPLEGAYCVIGKPSKEGPVVIVEGYATGESVHLATGWCVVVAFNAGNLIHVAHKIRKAMPEARIIIGADDDAWTVRPKNHPQAGEAWNPGIESAEAAAIEINATVTIPEWTRDRPHKHTDFNDLHTDEGLEVVKLCFNADYVPEPPQRDPVPGTDGKPASADAGKTSNTGSNAGDPSLSQGDAHGQQGRSLAPASQNDDEDVYIFASSPMDTAFRFQASLPDDGKILHWRGEFYIWNGYRYQVRDQVYLHQLIYAFMASCVTIKVNPKTGDEEVVGFQPTKTTVENVMHALRAVSFIDLDEPPNWIEQRAGDPPARELVPFMNGFLHLPTRTLLPSTPRLFLISALEFDYDPTAPVPVEWLRFLNVLWANDPQSIDALCEMFGYLLTDDTAQQKMFMMIGPPRCGKGTILRVLETLVGMHNRVSPSLASLGTQFGLQPLIGKRLAMISDARLSGRADQQPIVENLLRISGEDSLTIDRKNTTSWSGKLSTRFVMASNETPSFTDASAALPNRFIMFKLTRSFLGQEDHGLTTRLLRELPGILIWALAGLERLIARGYFVAPDSGQELADEMREQSSPISMFIAEKCVLGDGYQVERGELFTLWKEWCHTQGMDHPGTIISFGRRLSAAAAGIGRKQPTDMHSGERQNCYTGIRIRQHFDPF